MFGNILGNVVVNQRTILQVVFGIIARSVCSARHPALAGKVSYDPVAEIRHAFIPGDMQKQLSSLGQGLLDVLGGSFSQFAALDADQKKQLGVNLLLSMAPSAVAAMESGDIDGFTKAIRNAVDDIAYKRSDFFAPFDDQIENWVFKARPEEVFFDAPLKVKVELLEYEP